jgi:holliday junction DNA helicase RuvA
MLISLSGKITHKDLNFVILENNGAGYQIFMNTASAPAAGHDAKFFIYEHIREDRHDLYGFKGLDDLEFYLKLLSVDGVGPKMAQNISALGFDRVQKAVTEGNVAAIEAVHGVGKKTAQKIILELRGSIDKILAKSNINQDALSALLNLGYNRSEAERTLGELAAEISGTEAQIKAALKLLGKR